MESVAEKLDIAKKKMQIEFQIREDANRPEERRRWALDMAVRCANEQRRQGYDAALVDIERCTLRFINFMTTGKFEGAAL